MNLRVRIEFTLIYITVVLFLISLVSLGGRIAKTASYAEKYPALFAAVSAGDISADEKTVYLTFDDGPSPNTERILDVLLAEDVKATFFVSAQCDEIMDVKSILRRIVSEGHEIGLHTYTHDYGKVYRSLGDYLDDLNRINNYIIDATGYKPNIIRFPGGSHTQNAGRALMGEIIGEITRRGYRYYDWDVDSGDYSSTVNSVEFLVNNLTKTGDRQSVIVLMHDSQGPKTTPDAVKRAIPVLRGQGYDFGTLTYNRD